MNQKYLILGTSAFAVGFAGGFFYARKTTPVRYQHVEVAAVPQPVVDKNQLELLLEDPANVEADEAEEFVPEKEPILPEAVPVVVPIKKATGAKKKTNVFEGTSTWDQAAEEVSRKANVAYVIHKDEYNANDPEHKQETVTWYAGDNVLADAHDTPMYDKGRFGPDVLRFGHGSDDPNVVYIRSEKLRTDWEVLRHAGTFVGEVLGQFPDPDTEDEIMHSHTVPKFRDK